MLLTFFFGVWVNWVWLAVTSISQGRQQATTFTLFEPDLAKED